MSKYEIPKLTKIEIIEGLNIAKESLRKRHPIILHNKGDEFNRVFNFMMSDSYMQPHLHPGIEKIEKIYIVEGKLATIFFDEKGKIIQCNLLEIGGQEMISVPGYTWHTYIILSEYAITYETMMGKYDPQTWKYFFEITPAENSCEKDNFLNKLKLDVNKWFLAKNAKLDNI